MDKKETLRRIEVIKSKLTHQWDKLSEQEIRADIDWIKEPKI